ncbi:MAG: MBL fold metallo-hydrolase [Clostridiales bacterium]|nr:MBL fold metallo-hydrolase [Clostridiales bacterium]
MIFTPLASSSAGNAYLVTDGESRILLECGIPFRRLQRILSFTAHELDGVLITHEHKDHSASVEKMLECGVPVYASPGTVRTLELDGVVPFLLSVGRNMGPPFRVGSFTVVPFRTFHDAAEPVGYLLRGRDGEQLVFATDTVGLNYTYHNVQIYALEANYQEERLALSTRIPPERIKRIRQTHMEIGQLCAFLSRQDLQGCREIWLLHLSDSSSNEAYFVERVRQTVGPGIAVRAAPKAADEKGGKRRG